MFNEFGISCIIVNDYNVIVIDVISFCDNNVCEW